MRFRISGSPIDLVRILKELILRLEPIADGSKLVSGCFSSKDQCSLLNYSKCFFFVDIIYNPYQQRRATGEDMESALNVETETLTGSVRFFQWN